MKSNSMKLDLECIMFDLDNTLLYVPDKLFDTEIPKMLIYRFRDKFDTEIFKQYFSKSMEIMHKHDHGTTTNLEIFFTSFSSFSELPYKETKKQFKEFYTNDFVQLKDYCEPMGHANSLIEKIKDLGIKLILATHPLFPKTAVEQRLGWMNLDLNDFLYISHAENSTNSKPNPKYYQHLLNMADVDPENALMVGNDYLLDMAASAIGIKTWLVDKNLDHQEFAGKYHIDYNGSLYSLINFI